MSDNYDDLLDRLTDPTMSVEVLKQAASEAHNTIVELLEDRNVWPGWARRIIDALAERGYEYHPDEEIDLPEDFIAHVDGWLQAIEDGEKKRAKAWQEQAKYWEDAFSGLVAQRDAALLDLREIEAKMSEMKVIGSHAGEKVSWERIKDAHSSMLGHKTWEPFSPNSGHCVYNQTPDEACYMCTLLWLIDEAKKENDSIKSALRKTHDVLKQMFSATDRFGESIAANYLSEVVPIPMREMYDVAEARASFAAIGSEIAKVLGEE